ncbi:Formyl-coenzyme A transferase [Mycobacteroides abscessus subsp. abscessus]|nr:Formyl-coenzyme A transferase [Mycobacteroides abscessus subsp. abscessus]
MARTGHLLLDLPRRNGERQEFTVARESVESSFGTLSFAQPVAFSGGVRLTYRFPPGPYGNDPLSWAP